MFLRLTSTECFPQWIAARDRGVMRHGALQFRSQHRPQCPASGYSRQEATRGSNQICRKHHASILPASMGVIESIERKSVIDTEYQSRTTKYWTDRTRVDTFDTVSARGTDSEEQNCSSASSGLASELRTASGKGIGDLQHRGGSDGHLRLFGT
jgi:hypothetical protein